MRHWTICYTENNEVVYETLSEDYILNNHYDEWSLKMKSLGKKDEISKERFIEDWVETNLAIENIEE